MGLKKGNTNNPKGRPKGSLNKTTKDIRELFQSILDENLELINEDIKTLNPKDRILTLLKLSEFIVPKLKSIDLNGNFSQQNYKEYLELKTKEDEISNLTEKELDLMLKKLTNEEKEYQKSKKKNSKNGNK